jgi:hypothetical protein
MKDEVMDRLRTRRIRIDTVLELNLAEKWTTQKQSTEVHKSSEYRGVEFCLMSSLRTQVSNGRGAVAFEAPDVFRGSVWRLCFLNEKEKALLLR